MARAMARAFATLATTLVTVCSALQLAPEEELQICGHDKIPYEAHHYAYPDMCSVFCVPEGDCQESVQNGDLANFGITDEGNCLSKGYKKKGSLGPMGGEIAKQLKYTTGPCEGMTIMEFIKAPHYSAENCGHNQIPYESFNDNFPVCSVFCVPVGDCENLVHRGSLYYLGITGQGNCKRKGYTALAPFGVVSNSVDGTLKDLTGPCHGMKLLKFQKPETTKAPSAHPTHQKPETTKAPSAHPTQKKAVLPRQHFKKLSVKERCGNDMIPYEGFHPRYSGVCSIYCVPKGQCEEKVQLGQFQFLGIKNQGNCRNRGYTKALAYGGPASAEISNIFPHFKGGPCRKMKMFDFGKPGDGHSSGDPAKESTNNTRQSEKPYDGAPTTGTLPGHEE